MSSQEDKLVRFRDCNSQKTSRSESQLSVRDGEYSGSFRTESSSVLRKMLKYVALSSEGISSFRRSFNLRSLSGVSVTDEKPGNSRILDPQGSFLQKWNKIFVLSCVLALYLDPLFFYIPVVERAKNCLGLDEKLQITACVLRSFTDIFYVLHIIFQFRTGFIAPSSRVFGRGVLVEDLGRIAKRYMTSYFLIDILAVLPLPQVVIWFIIPYLNGSVPSNTKNVLRIVVFFQYVPRLFRIYPLYTEVTRNSGIMTQTAWAGAVLNLFIYILASHILGATWYFFSIEREDMCWREACKKNGNCDYASLYCRKSSSIGGNDFLNRSCPIITPDKTIFNFGMYLDALQSQVVETSTDFPQKIFYCLWWGLRSLSSLGQNLETSTYVWESLFAVTISIFGLVLFALLIGNMQTYLQSNTLRLEEMRVKRRDAEQWMNHRLLPENLRQRIRRYEQYRWQETRGVDEESLLRNLPKDLRRDIKRHLCLALLMRVPMFEKMDEQLLDAMCDRLKPVLYTEKSYIVREGDPVDEMLFIMRGKLLTITTNGGRTGFLNSEFLKAGDFCGEELLTWALVPHSSSNLPTSTRTVQSLNEVEAFALKAEDLKFVASQFRRLHSKQLRHTFRFHSQHWRTWAACFIQAAYRRYCRKKLEESLYIEENRLKNAMVSQTGNTPPSFGAAIYASRFAANILRTIRRSGTRKERLQDRLPGLLLKKPDEPDFSLRRVSVEF